RPGNELPVLMVVMNNGWGISTQHCTQHACKHVIDRGHAFNISGEVVDGNDPVASWFAVERAMRVCRGERRPFMLEAMVSRLYGHSSSSGAPHSGEPDCLAILEERLLDAGLIDQKALARVHAEAKAETDMAVAQAARDPKPEPGDVEKFTYADSPVD